MRTKILLCGLIVSLMVFLTAITTPAAAAAYTWVPVGSTGFSAGEADQIKLAVYNGTPYVAYSDKANGGKAVVEKYDGAYWLPLGNSTGISAGQAYPLLYIDNGTPYVAFYDGGLNTTKVEKYDGTSWVDVGAPGSFPNPTSLYVDNGTPYVAFKNSPGVVVMKYDGTSWVNVGALGISSSAPVFVNSPQLLVNNGTPYVAFNEHDSTNTYYVSNVMKYDGTSWVYVGGPNIIGSQSIGSQSLISGWGFDNGTLYVTFETSGEYIEKKYDGSNWINVSSAFSVVGHYNEAGTIYNGTPYIFYDDPPNGDKAEVIKYDGSNWVNVGSADFSLGSVGGGIGPGNISLSIDNGLPYVASDDGYNGNRATVLALSTQAVSVLSSSAAGGTVTGGGQYAAGAAVQANASTNSGYNFTGWTDANGAQVSTNSALSFTMGSAPQTLVANFQPVPLIKVVNGVPFSITINDTGGILTGTNTNYGTLTGVAGGNNGNVISGTLSGLSTTTPTDIPLGSGIIEVQAVNPPSTNLDSSKSFY